MVLGPWPELASQQPATLILPAWLHAVDMGIAADISGQLLFELSGKYPARRLKDRHSLLWLEVQELYKEHEVGDRLARLARDVINKGKKQHGPPSLHCPAATVRHLVPLMPALTAKHFAVGTDHEKACHSLAKFLAKVYSKVEANQISGLAQNSAKVAAQYMALEKEALRVRMPLIGIYCPSYICSSTSVNAISLPKVSGAMQMKLWEDTCPSSFCEEVVRTILAKTVLEPWRNGKA